MSGLPPPEDDLAGMSIDSAFLQVVRVRQDTFGLAIEATFDGLPRMVGNPAHSGKSLGASNCLNARLLADVKLLHLLVRRTYLREVAD
jgi:hypothetical protein